MLLNSFFKINTIQSADKHLVSVELNAAHPIFKGHFPNNPITPGVCMTQMVKECIEHITNKKLTLLNANNIKFLAILNPELHPQSNITIGLKEKETDVIQAEGSISAGEITFFTFKGSFKVN